MTDKMKASGRGKNTQQSYPPRGDLVETAERVESQSIIEQVTGDEQDDATKLEGKRSKPVDVSHPLKISTGIRAGNGAPTKCSTIS